jgi:hypothetical protein
LAGLRASFANLSPKLTMSYLMQWLQVQDYPSSQLALMYPQPKDLVMRQVSSVGCLRKSHPFSTAVKTQEKSPVVAWQADHHWYSIALCSTNKIVWVHDPLGGYDQEMRDLLHTTFHPIGWDVRQVTIKPLQQDGHNCGIWAVFFARIWAQWLAQVRWPMGCVLHPWVILVHPAAHNT